MASDQNTHLPFVLEGRDKRHILSFNSEDLLKGRQSDIPQFHAVDWQLVRVTRQKGSDAPAKDGKQEDRWLMEA